jgi:hypothetical protein
MVQGSSRSYFLDKSEREWITYCPFIEAKTKNSKGGTKNEDVT